MRALYLIPKNPPPKLNEKTGKWSKNFREFVKDALVKNPAKRPSAQDLMKVAKVFVSLRSIFTFLPSQHPWFKLLASTKGILGETVQKSSVRDTARLIALDLLKIVPARS